MKTEIYNCDVCKKEMEKSKQMAPQVIFYTEQTEGRSVDPYLYYPIMDICSECIDKILQGAILCGSGAQGNNQYWFAKQ